MKQGVRANRSYNALFQVTREARQCQKMPVEPVTLEHKHIGDGPNARRPMLSIAPLPVMPHVVDLPSDDKAV